jgi:micrococcal nuclease
VNLGTTLPAGLGLGSLFVSLMFTINSVNTVPAKADTTSAATVVSWSDGDTVVTDLGKVRLIGINAPDTGECGYGKATKSANKLAPVGSVVTLTLPDGHDDVDQYGRLLRYVGVGSTDIGLKQIKAGSVAKFDSTDGYGAHPKESKYRKTDIKKRDYCGNSDLSSYAPVSANACPKKAPIKGNRSEDWIYHLPSNQYYSVTNPEECFASGDGAKKHGYRASLV